MNGHKVDARGDYIGTPSLAGLNMSHIVRGQAFVGDDFKVKVLRDGKEESLTGKLLRKEPEGLPRLALSLRPRRTSSCRAASSSKNSPLPFLQSFRRRSGRPGAPLRLVFITKHTERIR